MQRLAKVWRNGRHDGSIVLLLKEASWRRRLQGPRWRAGESLINSGECFEVTLSAPALANSSSISIASNASLVLH